VVGAGRIGGALIGYPDLRRQGFDIRAVFDRDPEKVGRTWSGLVVHELSALERILQSEPIDIAILAVPAAAAQEMAGRVVRAGVRAILNFAPVKLALPPEVAVKNVDMAVELEGLSYALSRGVNGTAAANATAAASGAAGTGGTGGGAA
jgi:redox-sensing transcriptional repressor